MELLLNIDIRKLPVPINYRDSILLVGSCFTEHIGNTLGEIKYQVLQNPNGILFGPDSVCKSLLSYVHGKTYTEKDLFKLNELWTSWNHHSRYAHPDKQEALELINNSQKSAHDFLKEAAYVIITLGSAFSYRLTDQAVLASERSGNGVANCHRAPATWFTKELLAEENIREMLEGCIRELIAFNPKLRFILTISPVRHVRDGVVENNRSKARLISAVHNITEQFERAYYFPAYELVVDVLRDYRFYDIDLVHPNYAATEFVLERFSEHCIDEDSRKLMKEIKTIVTARKHRPFQPNTEAHHKFLTVQLERALLLQHQYPFLDLRKEIDHFSQS